MARQAKREYAEFYKFTPSGPVTYIQLLEDSDNPTRRHTVTFFDKSDKPTYHGEMTRHAKIRMRKALFLLLEIADKKKVINPSTNKPFTFRINFITLPFSAFQIHARCFPLCLHLPVSLAFQSVCRLIQTQSARFWLVHHSADRGFLAQK